MIVLLNASATASPPVLKGLGGHPLFLLLVQVCVLLAAARLLGELMRKLNQPPVVGELCAGVLLGPSVLGLMAPSLQASVFPRVQAQADLLGVVSWLGVLFLLVVTGLETDLNLIVRKGKSALVVSLGGIVLPFASGLLLGWAVPEAFLADPKQRVLFSLFIAVAMSISAVPVIAKVLMDMKLIRRDIGQITLAAAMTDDTVGWILLSIVAGLATRGKVDVVSAARWAGGAVLFLILAFTVGRPLVAHVIKLIDKVLGDSTTQLSAILVLAFGAAALTHEMGIEAVLGAFVVGILVGESPRFRQEVGHTLEIITTGFLAPIFFASAGLRVDLLRLFNPQVALIGFIVLAIACIGKFVGVYLGAWAGGLSHWERLALGSGMNARGAMEIIVATVGLSLGVLNLEMYSIVVMVAIVTSIMAPPLLRWTLAKVTVGAEEASRLESEALAASSFVRSVRRVLFALGPEGSASLATEMLHGLGTLGPIDVTLFHAPGRTRARDSLRFWSRQRDSDPEWNSLVSRVRESMKAIPNLSIDVKAAPRKALGHAVVDEAAKGYDLVVMQADDRSEVNRSGIGYWLDRVVSEAVEVADPRRALFEHWIDHVVQNAGTPTLVLKVKQIGANERVETTPAKRRILVPTVGTEYSEQAVEVAAAVSAAQGGTVTIVHVVNRPAVDDLLMDANAARSARTIGELIVERQAEMARKLGAEVRTLVIEGGSPENEILRLAATREYDLIVMGSNLRHVSGRAFFGHRVDNTLNRASCPVAVVSS